MKCPARFGRYEFEGGEECRADCALSLTTSRGRCCAVAAEAAALLVRSGCDDAYGVRIMTEVDDGEARA